MTSRICRRRKADASTITNAHSSKTSSKSPVRVLMGTEAWKGGPQNDNYDTGKCCRYPQPALPRVSGKKKLGGGGKAGTSVKRRTSFGQPTRFQAGRLQTIGEKLQWVQWSQDTQRILDPSVVTVRIDGSNNWDRGWLRWASKLSRPSYGDKN